MPITTNLDLIDWIIANTDKTNTPDAEEAARWFVACQMAKEVFECYTTKDLANLIMSGVGPVDDEYVTSWLQTREELRLQAEDECGKSPIPTVTLLEEHFGLDE